MTDWFFCILLLIITVTKNTQLRVFFVCNYFIASTAAASIDAIWSIALKTNLS